MSGKGYKLFVNVNKMVKRETNLALEEGRKILSHTTISQSQLLTPTELGQRLGISAVDAIACTEPVLRYEQ